MRDQISLTGLWQFKLDPEGTIQSETLIPDRQIPVPMPWQAAFPELETYSGYAWYQREFTLDESWLTGEILLTFGAVDYWCEVFVNGQRLGEHEGGYTPFTFPIRQVAQAGANLIAIRVYDAAQRGIAHGRWLENGSVQSSDPLHIPHGKQEWYLNVGGLWQAVTLTRVPAAYLDQLRITPANDGKVRIQAQLIGAVDALDGSLRATIGGNETHLAAEIKLQPAQTQIDITIQVESPQLWTPETPTLYQVNLALVTQNGSDTLSARFGFREISIHEGNLLLNGQPLFLRAALDQDMYPETIYTVPSEAFLRDEFQKAKALGLNCLRCHIKIPDPLYLDLADEMGLLVWEEIPSWRTFYLKTTLHDDHFNNNALTRCRVEQTLHEMIKRDYNHPSIIIWTLVNEDWGTATALSSNDREWLILLYNLCKQLDPTRLVVDNSACLNNWGPNLHVKSDLDDFHIYTNIPDQSAWFARFIEQFSLRPTWTYSSHGDAHRTGHEPLILSEFGNWGLPSVAALSDAQGNPPAWFKLGPWWSGWDGEPGWPEGVLERFERLGLSAIWRDYEAFAAASQWHQYQAMKYEIEVMRRQPSLKGYVITELSDIYWESNGLLDFNRGEKAYHAVFGQINAADVIISQPEQHAAWDDQSLAARLHVSHYSARNWEGALLKWTNDGQSHTQPLPALAQGDVVDLGTVEWAFKTTTEAETQQIALEVQSATGETLARNVSDILVLPAAAQQASWHGTLAFSAGNTNAERAETTTLQTALEHLGYRTTTQADSQMLLMTSRVDKEILGWTHAGGTLFYLCQGVSPFFWVQGRGGVYSGAWITSYNWLRPGVYARLGAPNPLTMPFANIAPTGVIVGLPVEDSACHADFLAGQFTGWIQHPAIHTVQFRYGQGKVLMTTFNLLSNLTGKSSDPVATAMLHDLIDHLTSTACQPVLTVTGGRA